MNRFNKVAFALTTVALLMNVFITAFIYVNTRDTTPHLELSVESTHEEGVWLRVDSAKNVHWNESRHSHTTQRLHFVYGPIVEGEFWWVPSSCGTDNIYTVNREEDFLTAIHFTTEPCPDALTSLIRAANLK